jgi:ankyrin repeat protein
MTDLTFNAHAMADADARFLYAAKVRSLQRETSPDLVVQFADELLDMAGYAEQAVTPLMALAEAGNWDAVRVMLCEREGHLVLRSPKYNWAFTHMLAARDTPADIWTQVAEIAPGLLDAENCTGLTPLGCASARGNCDAMRFLLLEAANPDGGSKGLAPLAAAAMLCGAEPVGILLKAGAQLDFAREDGVTALMQAAIHDNVEAIAALKAAGADDSKVNLSKKTALGLAKDNKCQAAVKALGGAAKAKKPAAKKAKKPAAGKSKKPVLQVATAA